MQSAQSTFISSTFWTERTGYVAALKTLEEMNKIRSWEKISKLGKFIKKNWLKSARKHKLRINIVGLDSIPSFSIDSKRWIKYKSYFTYRMLKNNIYASLRRKNFNLCFTCGISSKGQNKDPEGETVRTKISITD